MNLETLAWYDPERMIIKVRVLYRDQGVNKGVILEITEQMLCATAEGSSFIHAAPTDFKAFDPDNPMDESLNRWEIIAKEAEEENGKS